MSSAPPKTKDEAPASDDAPKKSGKGKLILLAIPLVLVLAGAGLWFTGILPHLLGMDKKTEEAAAKEPPKPVPPSYVDLPEMVANLNGTHKAAYVKLVARLEVPAPEDVEKVKAALPKLQDLFQTYLREMRPEELKGSAGTYRLKEELLVRANAAVAPAKVSDVLFVQMLLQ